MPIEQQTTPATEGVSPVTPDPRPAAEPPPAAPAVYPKQKFQPLYELVTWAFRMIGRIWLRQELIGLENVPKEGPVLILPTHTSFADPPMVGSNVPRVCHYLSREGILKVPIMGPTCQKRLNAHPIRRGASDREAIRTCRSILKQGYPLLFFPEGTRSRDGRLGPIQGGFAMILEGLDVPYIPVMSQSTYHILRRGWFFPRPRKLTIIYGKPAKLPARQQGESTRDYFKRCGEDLERRWRELGAQ